MTGLHLRRWRVFVFATSVILAGWTLSAGVATAAHAPVQDDEVFDENETQGTIDRVRYQLLAIAGVTGVLLVLYVWHTDPQRRLRVATRRRDEREREAMEELDDTFVLPADIDLTADDDEAEDGEAEGDVDATDADGGADAPGEAVAEDETGRD